MRHGIGSGRASLAAALLLALPAASAIAAPGDVHRVTAEKVNLRSGPTENANIRSTLTQDEQVVEIRSEEGWVGVRSLNSGAEGWIFGDLLALATPSGLDDPAQGGAAAQAADMGFRSYSQEFDTLLAGVARQIGHESIFDSVKMGDNGVLQLTPAESFMRESGQDAHILAALAVHQMLKNHQNGRPVAVSLLDPSGEDYISASDMGDSGPELLVSQLRSASR